MADGGGALNRVLTVGPPSGLDEAPATLAFDRRREVEIPWAELLEYMYSGRSLSSNQAIQDYFETSWGVEGYEPGLEVHLHLIVTPPATEGDPNPTPIPEFYIVRMSEGSPLTEAEIDAGAKQRIQAIPSVVPSGAVLADGYGRYFLVHTSEGYVATKESMQDDLFYDRFWENVERVELCAPTSEESLAGYTAVEQVDLFELQILEAYDSLEAQRKFDVTVQAELGGATAPLIQSALASGLDIEQIDRIQDSAVTISLRSFQIQRRLERLAGRAAELGYKLWIDEPDDIVFPDGKTRPLQAGQLYRQFKRTYAWTTEVDRVEVVPAGKQFLQNLGSLVGIKSPEPRKWKEKIQHSQTVTDVELVDANSNALIDKIEEVAATHTVYLLSDSGQGWVADDGSSLQDIMLRCLRDEEFRRRCALFLPISDFELGGRPTIIGYHVIQAPFPGLVPTQFPRLAILESLAYRMSWTGTTLGELAASINLAPGESREITVSRSFDEETSTARSVSSLAELDATETSDFEDELKEELSTEKNVGWDLKLSGESTIKATDPKSGASGSTTRKASLGYTNTLQTVSDTLNRAVKRASKSVNNKRRDEVTTDTRRTTRVATTNEYTAQVSNINQGRTLNLMFHRLMNNYETGLYLEDLRLEVTSSTELVAGTGIHETSVFELDRLDDMMNAFGFAQLPLPLDKAFEPAYLRAAISSLEAHLDREYAAPAGKNAPAKTLSSGSVGLVTLPPPTEPEIDTDGERAAFARFAAALNSHREQRDGLRQDHADDHHQIRVEDPEVAAASEALEKVASKNLEEKAAQVRQRLGAADLRGRLIKRQTVELVAPGLYVDALVGAMPATEEYSESMRAHTLALKAAEVEQALADAEFRRAEAAALHGRVSNLIVGILPQVEATSLSIVLRKPLAAGSWQLLVDGDDVADIPNDQIGNSSLLVEFLSLPDWLDDQDLLTGRVTLADDAGRVVRTAL